MEAFEPINELIQIIFNNNNNKLSLEFNIYKVYI